MAIIGCALKHVKWNLQVWLIKPSPGAHEVAKLCNFCIKTKMTSVFTFNGNFDLLWKYYDSRNISDMILSFLSVDSTIKSVCFNKSAYLISNDIITYQSHFFVQIC